MGSHLQQTPPPYQTTAILSPFLQKLSPVAWPRLLPCTFRLRLGSSGPFPSRPHPHHVTRPRTWLVHALLDIFQLRGGQSSDLLLKAAVTLFSQLPEARSRPCASPTLQADRHFLKAVSETEIVANGILPALWSRPEKGKMLSVDKEEWSGKLWFLWEMPYP